LWGGWRYDIALSMIGNTFWAYPGARRWHPRAPSSSILCGKYGFQEMLSSFSHCCLKRSIIIRLIIAYLYLNDEKIFISILITAYIRRYLS
jgi:hypothetical protein